MGLPGTAGSREIRARKSPEMTRTSVKVPRVPLRVLAAPSPRGLGRHCRRRLVLARQGSERKSSPSLPRPRARAAAHSHLLRPQLPRGASLGCPAAHGPPHLPSMEMALGHVGGVTCTDKESLAGSSDQGVMRATSPSRQRSLGHLSHTRSVSLGSRT